jgi:hypothetical protein
MYPADKESLSKNENGQSFRYRYFPNAFFADICVPLPFTSTYNPCKLLLKKYVYHKARSQPLFVLVAHYIFATLKVFQIKDVDIYWTHTLRNIPLLSITSRY